MPYTEAVIAETLRYSSILPNGAFQRVVKDTEFRGYTIPKDTNILHNVLYIHFDPAVWVDPEKFRPERFLSVDEKVFKKNEALMPFSTGRRQCLGETLVRHNLFFIRH
jgi:cytochrome P450